jgi:CelD/BcsL family acetyltransferase involved in cellulose biosynthesis
MQPVKKHKSGVQESQESKRLLRPTANSHRRRNFHHESKRMKGTSRVVLNPKKPFDRIPFDALML